MDETICRFAVGSATGPRSSSYRVWAAKNSSDFFIAGRSTAGLIKVSVHAPRPEKGLEQQSHHGLTAQYAAELRASGKWAAASRLFATWEGREVTPVLREQFLLFIPGYALRAFSEPAGKLQGVQWIPAPPPEHSVMVAAYVAAPDVNLPSEGLLGHGRLRDGRLVLIVHRTVPRSSAEFDPRQLSRAKLDLRKFSPEELQLSCMRALLLGRCGATGAWTEMAGDLLLAGMRGELT